jgi:hypothetical protein
VSFSSISSPSSQQSIALTLKLCLSSSHSTLVSVDVNCEIEVLVLDAMSNLSESALPQLSFHNDELPSLEANRF